MARSAFHTVRWKAVPSISSGASNSVRSPAKYSLSSRRTSGKAWSSRRHSGRTAIGRGASCMYRTLSTSPSPTSSSSPIGLSTVVYTEAVISLLSS